MTSAAVALIRSRLEGTQLRQGDLARLTGISASAISRILSGERSLSPHHALLIARALDVAPGQLHPGLTEAPVTPAGMVDMVASLTKERDSLATELRLWKGRAEQAETILERIRRCL